MATTVVSITPGTLLVIRFLDDKAEPTDGEFTVAYPKSGQEIIVSESAGLPGSIKGGAEEVLYHEKYVPDPNLPEEVSYQPKPGDPEFCA